MKLIDKYLTKWNYSKKNSVSLIGKDLPEVSIIHNVDFSKSNIIRFLFKLRGLPINQLTINEFTKTGFILLEEGKYEVVIGLIAQPWKMRANPLKLTPEQFMLFDRYDYTKIAWNFLFETNGKHIQTITETRIHCTSDSAIMKFSLYWIFISLFSGMVRNEMLRIIKKEVEQLTNESRTS